MQRIKSQSICQPQNNSIGSQSRPRSKKTAKAQSSQLICNMNDKSKNTNGAITQHSMVSIKSNGRPLSGSMKNLKVSSQNQTNVKCSAQNTSRGTNIQSSAISARILKEIVGYTQTRTSRPKGGYKDSNLYENKEEPTIKIDLTDQIENLYGGVQKQEQQFRTTLSNNRKKSQQRSEDKQRQTRNSSNDKNKRHRGQHRIVQQFSPLNQSPQRQDQVKVNGQSKKYSFFNDPCHQQILKEDSQKSRIEISNRNLSLHHQYKESELSCFNYQTFKNYSSFNDIQEENKLEITNNFLKIASPHHLLSSLEKSKVNNALQVQNASLMRKGNLKISQQVISKNGKGLEQEISLLQQKQKLVITLQDINAILEEHYQFKFKEIVHFWNQIILSQSKQRLLLSELKQLENGLKRCLKVQLEKKTELFELNRDQICRRKQKDYVTKSNKDKYIHEAVSCQQALRLKLSSKADYEHMILFNEKVVLTGRNSTQDLEQLFKEMFDSKLTKKFGLIAKKQIASLSVYDSRLIQDFLKRIQELESLYSKSEGHTSSQTVNHYSSGDEQLKLEALVEQIQQITLQLELTNSRITSKGAEVANLRRKINGLHQIIQQYIKSTNEKVSGEYKMTEGYSFDFETLLEEKYATQFQNYRKQLSERDQIVGRLSEIQKRLASLGTNKQNCSAVEYNSNAKDNQSNRSSQIKQSERKSISFVSTPNRSPLKIDKSQKKDQQNPVWPVRKTNLK